MQHAALHAASAASSAVASAVTTAAAAAHAAAPSTSAALAACATHHPPPLHSCLGGSRVCLGELPRLALLRRPAGRMPSPRQAQRRMPTGLSLRLELRGAPCRSRQALAAAFAGHLRIAHRIAIGAATIAAAIPARRRGRGVARRHVDAVAPRAPSHPPPPPLRHRLGALRAPMFRGHLLSGPPRTPKRPSCGLRGPLRSMHRSRPWHCSRPATLRGARCPPTELVAARGGLSTHSSAARSARRETVGPARAGARGRS